MKIMFVYPAFENIGIEYLSAVLKTHGFQTKLAFDPRLFSDQFIKLRPLGRFFSYENILLNKIKSYDPQLIAFSVVSGDYSWALSVAEKIKGFSSAHITFGGIHPSSAPEETIRHESIDSVIIGEGEFALLELADALKNKKSAHDIENIWLKEDGAVIKNRLRPYIEDLDSVPFPDKELYYNEIPSYRTGYTIITRRGCINSCSYCHNTVWQKWYPNDKRIRLRSVDNVIKELSRAKKRYNFKLLRINDDLFTYEKNWLSEFARRYSKEIDVPLYCFGSPATVDEEVVGLLKKCRCYQLCLGVQSVNPRINSQIFRRKETNEQVIRALMLCKKYKIRIVADNIIGYPGEKDNDFLETAEFYDKYRADRICVFWLVYYPGTNIVDVAREQGLLDDNDIQGLAARPYDSANTLYNKAHSKERQRYCLFLELYHILPPPIFRWMLKRKIFRFLPRINPAIIGYLYTIFARDRLDIPRIRYYKRYLKFIPEVLSNNITENFKSLAGRR
jgi:radical SAM superfamily enzyme YgiQ (UPF0313 family)